MARRLERIVVRKDFLRVAAGRRRFVAPGLILQVISIPQVTGVCSQKDGPRLGFTATKKIGNAVIRNRSKRRLRAAAQLIMAEHAAPDHDYVLIARNETKSRVWALLLEDLERALRHMHVYR